MIPYASRTGTRRNLDALREAGWRLMVSARGVLRTEGFRYALDNGAWTAHQKGEPFDVAAYKVALDRLGEGAEWVVLPDIVCGGMASLDLSASWMLRSMSACRMVLVAVQDGMKPGDLHGFGLGRHVGIFVGGSTDWKERTAAMWANVAHEQGAICHVGRVNTIRRIRICADAGADSFDGSSASRFAVNIPMLDGARRQTSLVPGCYR